MDQIPFSELLSGTHEFPCVYQFKAIGVVEGGFRSRVIEAAVAEVESPDLVEHTVRETPGGRHVAVTIHVSVQTPEQVQSIYSRIKELDGLLYLL